MTTSWFLNPHPLLRDFIKSYCIVYLNTGVESSRTFEGLPVFQFDIFFQFGSPLVHKCGSEWNVNNSRAFVTGYFDQSVSQRFESSTKIIAISLSNTGPYHLLGTSCSEFRNKFVELDSVFGRDGILLIDKLESLENDVMIKNVLDKFFLEKFILRKIDNRILDALKHIELSSGTQRISELTRKVGLSERKLQREFKRIFGTSMEKLAKLARFARAADLILSDNELKLINICEMLNYSDPSHLIKDVRKFSGRTLSQLKNSSSTILAVRDSQISNS